MRAVLRLIRFRSSAVDAALLFGTALLLAGCATDPSHPPEGEIVPAPPADEEMCRERFRSNLCPEVYRPWV